MTRVPAYFTLSEKRDFLKGIGTLALAAVASGLLCGAAAEPEETEPDTALCTVGGLRVLDVRARVYDYPNSDYPYHMEVYFDLENANDFTAYFHQENYIVSVVGKRYDTSDFTGLNNHHLFLSARQGRRESRAPRRYADHLPV